MKALILVGGGFDRDQQGGAPMARRVWERQRTDQGSRFRDEAAAAGETRAGAQGKAG